MGWWHDMRLNHKDCRLFWLVHRFVRRSLSEGGSLGEGGSRPRWGWGSAAPSGRSYRGTASAPSGRGYSGGRGYKTRDGVALIVVLGFLSIMLMMAVAFLTQARIERMVSDYSLEAQRGRQLLRTGVNAAMNDYSRYLSGLDLVMPITDEARLFTSMAPSPAFGISGPEGTLGGSGIQLLVGEVEDWIPRIYMRHLVPSQNQTPDMLDGPDIVAGSEWILVREDPSDNQSRILGRYAYACFDMSGGMDANLIAGEDNIAGHDARAASNRVRRSVRQVPMKMLPETANGGEFKRLRRGWKGFDSLQSLILLTDGDGEDGNGGNTRWHPDRKEFSAGLSSNLVSDLTPFSLSAFRGARYSLASGLWTPYTLIDQNTTWSSVLAPLASQFASGWGSWIDKAIDDYTSSSATPNGTDYPSPKNVPMFNELAGTFRLDEVPDGTGSSDYFLEMELTPEFWYPFPSEDNQGGGSFTLDPPKVGGSFAGSGTDEQIWMRIALMGTSVNPQNFELGPPVALPPAVTVNADYNGGRPYVPNPPGTPSFTYRFPVIEAGAGTNLLSSGGTLRIQGVVVQQPIELMAGAPADMLPSGLTLKGPMNLQDGGPAEKFAVEATDPRLNHIPGQWVTAPSDNHSLNEMNSWYDSNPTAFMQEGTNLYCRNGPMETPAELGFIPTGNEWETIDLCTDSAADLLATLVMDTNLWESAGLTLSSPWQTNNVFYTNGTINPNTRSSNVLMSAFVDLPRHEAPNIDSAKVAANPLNDDTSDGLDIIGTLVDDILKETDSGKIGNCFQAGTDWVRVGAMQQGGALASKGLNNNQREELIRRTWGLFSPDNSLFTVVVVAQAIKEGPNDVGIWNKEDDLITGERRGVVLVWRDPFKTGQNLHHEMFVRMFRYLND